MFPRCPGLCMASLSSPPYRHRLGRYGRRPLEANSAVDRAVPGEPGLEGEAGEGLRSGLQGGDREEEGRCRPLEGRDRAACGVPGATRSPGHLRRVGRASGARCRGQGRDDPPRDERPQPSGCARRELQGPVGARAQPGLPPPLSGAAAVARGDRDLQPVALREVLVVRVYPENLLRQKLPSETREHHVWARRYDAINAWERYLSDNGFRIVKLFLNLSREEQRVRFLRCIDLPDHNWKFSSHDVEERQFWDAYQDAFSEMFSHTSTTWAPWYVIPADRKWFARIAAAAVIANALIQIDPQYPRLGEDALRDLEKAKLALEAQAPSGAVADPFQAGALETPGAQGR